MNKQVKEISKEDRKIICQYCQRSEINSLEWGPMYQLAGVTVHYFCMLFSAGLSQNGEDEEGILGFLPIDIRKELKRGDKLKCKYCKLPRATIGCSVKTCKASYHYPCGLNKKAIFHFIGNYESYCSQHKEVVDIPLPKEEWECPICFCEVNEEDIPLWPPCCKKKVFHKTCIMEMAKNHGAHFFKCPLCNDKDIFSVAMRRSGVYLPDRDASWETVPNAFAEHNRLYSRCDASECLCPKGRDYSSKSESKPWKVVRCGACGAAGIHRRCGNLKNLTWRCPTCAAILSDKRKNESLNSSRIQRHQYDLSSDEEIEEEAPVLDSKSVITEPPEIEDSTSTTTSTDSDCDNNKRITQIFRDGYGRNLILSDSEDSTDSDDTTEEVFVQNQSKIRQVLESRVMVSGEIIGDVRKSERTRFLRNFIKSIYGNSQLGTFNVISQPDHCVIYDDDDEKWTCRANTFDIKLNSIVQCCRQSSNAATPSDNVSNPVRTDSSGLSTTVQFPPVGRDNLIKMQSRKILDGKVKLDAVPEVISESQSRGVKISLKSISNRTDSEPCASNTATNNSGEEKNNTVHTYDDGKSHRGADASPSTSSGSNSAKRQSEQVCITLDDDDSDSSASDVEIVSEKLQPIPCTKTTAFLEMVNKVRGTKSAPIAPVIRLGVDDHQNDDIEIGESINQVKPAITFSSSRKPAAGMHSISAAFLRVINSCKEPAKSHFSGRLSSVVRNNKTSGPDRDVETVEISDDEATPQSSSITNQGESNVCFSNSSSKRNRLSPPNPAHGSNQNKRQRTSED